MQEGGVGGPVRPIPERGADADFAMVLPDRIELSTSSLPMKCSTTELRQRLKAPAG